MRGFLHWGWRAVASSALACALSAPTAAAETAVIVDTALSASHGPGARTFFIVERIDGRQVRNSYEASHAASFGQGAALRTLPFERRVPAAVPLRLTLLGLHSYGMPAAQILMSLTSQAEQVSGEVVVTLDPDKTYRVNGVLDGKFRREVWLEEDGSGRVLAKIEKPLSAEEQQDLAAADRYTCCNLHHHDRWISDGNWAEHPFLPPGQRVRIKDWGRNRAHVRIEGRPIEAGPDQSHDRQTREQFADRIFVREDPRPRIASWPPEVQSAIGAGKVMKGMTREQVQVSLGVPRPDRNPDPMARRLVYFASETAEFDVDFDADDRVTGVQAASRVRRIVWTGP